MAEHKHAAVLRAIADKGFLAAERPNNSCAGAWVSPSIYCNPLTNPEFEWRIKPEPKTDVVRYVNLYDTEACVNRFHAMGADDLLGTIKCTIDGETGKLKSAEVLP